MLTAIRRRRSWAIIASIAAHLGVLIAVLLQHPTLKIPVEPGGPPVAIIPLLILPRAPAPATGQGLRPAPIQLHRRPQRNLPLQTPIAPLVLPTAKPSGASTPAVASASPREPQQPLPAPDAVRTMLRTTLGCTDARMAGLSREERAGCLERLGRGARDEPYLAQPLSADKRAALDQAGGAKLANRAALERPLSPIQVSPPAADYDGEPETAHNTIPPAQHPPSKRAAQVLGRLAP